MARRKRIVGLARQQASRERAEPVSSPELADIHRDTPEILGSFMRALGAVAAQDVNEGDAARSLGQSLVKIACHKRALDECPRRRPFVAVWEGTKGALNGLDDAAQAWIEAFGSPDPLEAQRLAERAQQSLDDAPRLLESASDALKNLNDALDDGGSAQLLALVARRSAARAESSGSADAAAADVYRSVTGHGFVPEHRGNVLLYEDERARLMFDRERYWSIAADVYSELHVGDNFSRTVTAPAWRHAYLAAAERLADTAILAESVGRHAYHHRQLVRADLDLIKTLLEGPCKTLLRTRLAIKRKRNFGEIRGDIRSLLDQSEQAGWGPSLLGLNKSLRDAISHENYELDGTSLVLNRGLPTETSFNPEELADQVLACMESTLAMHTGITLVLLELDTTLAEDSARAGISPEQACWLGFEMGRQPLADVRVSGNASEVTYMSGFTPQTISAVAGTCSLLPNTIERMAITSTEDGILEGSLALFRHYESAADELQKELAIWRILTQWTLNGRPVAHKRLWRCWATTKAVRTRDADPAVAITQLRSLRHFAEEVGDDELRKLMTGMIRFHRHRLLAMPLSHQETESLLHRVDAWGHKPDDWPKILPEGKN